MMMQALPIQSLPQGVRTTPGWWNREVLSSLGAGQVPRDRGEQLRQERPS